MMGLEWKNHLQYCSLYDPIEFVIAFFGSSGRLYIVFEQHLFLCFIMCVLHSK